MGSPSFVSQVANPIEGPPQEHVALLVLSSGIRVCSLLFLRVLKNLSPAASFLSRIESKNHFPPFLYAILMCRVIVELSLRKSICVNAVPPLNALWVPVCLPCVLRSLPCVSAFVQKTGLHMTVCALPGSFHCCKPCVNLFSMASPNSEGWVVHKERSLVKPTFLVVLALSTGFGLSLVKASLWISSQWRECVHGDVIW